MSLVSVVQDVCAVVGVEMPTAVIPNVSSSRTMFEMVKCANEMAQRIAGDSREWRRLKKMAQFPGDGAVTHLSGDPPEGVFRGTTAWDLPADYKRMLLSTNVWRSTSVQQPMLFIADTDLWIQRRAAGFFNGWGEWTLLGDQMLIEPIMAGPIWDLSATPPVLVVPAVTASFAYLDRNCIALNGGGFGETFQNDLDAFRLDERLLKLGMIWQWKAQKGAQYAEDLSTYTDALDTAAGADKPGVIIVDKPVINPWTVGHAYYQ